MKRIFSYSLLAAFLCMSTITIGCGGEDTSKKKEPVKTGIGSGVKKDTRNVLDEVDDFGKPKAEAPAKK
jgi:hypothetical protein